MAEWFGPRAHPERCGVELPDLARWWASLDPVRASLPGLIIVGAALLLQFLTWWRIGGTVMTTATTETPLFLWTFAGLIALGSFLWQQGEQWLGATVIYIAINAIFRQTNQALVTAWWITLAAVGYALIRKIDRRLDPHIRSLLVLAGLAQALYAILQWTGTDPLFGAASPAFDTSVRGFFGHKSWLGAGLAISGAMAPAILLPLFGLALICSGSLGGFLTLLIALAWRTRRFWGLYGVILAAGLSAMLSERVWLLLGRWHSWDTLYHRLHVWGMGLGAWLAGPLLWGFGPGSWYYVFPRLEHAQGGFAEWYVQAHSEYIQAAFELGLVGVLLIAALLWQARGAILDGLYGPALVAVLIACAWGFPLHLATLVGPILVIAGRATARAG